MRTSREVDRRPRADGEWNSEAKLSFQKVNETQLHRQSRSATKPNGLCVSQSE